MTSNHQTTNFVFPNFFYGYFSAWAVEKENKVFIRLLNNKFRGLSPSGGCASLSFDQGVPKKLPTAAPSSRLERQQTVFYIDQIVSSFFVYYLNWSQTEKNPVLNQ